MSYNAEKEVKTLQVKIAVSESMSQYATYDVVKVTKKEMFNQIATELDECTDNYPVGISIDELENGDTVYGVKMNIISDAELRRLRAIEAEYEKLRETMFYGSVRIRQARDNKQEG